MSASLASELSQKPHTAEDLALLAEVVKKCQRDKVAGKSSSCLPNTAALPPQHSLGVQCICTSAGSRGQWKTFLQVSNDLTCTSRLST